MTRYEVVRGSMRHVRPMARRMRQAAAVAFQRLGADPRRALHDVVLESRYCRAAIADGTPIAMWGVHGAIMSSEARVWLVLSEDAARMPAALLVREARAELEDILDSYERITTIVIPDDEASVRFALYLGFHGGEGEGSHRARAQRIVADPSLRVPVGDGWVIALNYGGG